MRYILYLLGVLDVWMTYVSDLGLTIHYIPKAHLTFPRQRLWETTHPRVKIGATSAHEDSLPWI